MTTFPFIARSAGTKTIFIFAVLQAFGCSDNSGNAGMFDANTWADASSMDAAVATDATVPDAGDARVSDDASGLPTNDEPRSECPGGSSDNERVILAATDTGVQLLARDDEGRLRKLETALDLPGRFQAMAIRSDGEEALIAYGNEAVTPALAVVEMNTDGSDASLTYTVELGEDIALKHVFYLDEDRALVLFQPSGTRAGGAIPLLRGEDQRLVAYESTVIPNGVPFWADVIDGTHTLLTSTWKGAADPNPIVAITHNGETASQSVISSEYKVGGLVAAATGVIYTHSGNHPDEDADLLNKRGVLRKFEPMNEEWLLDETIYWAPTNASELVLSPDEQRMVMVDAYREWIKDPDTGVERIAITSQAVYEQTLASLSSAPVQMPPSFRLQSSMSPAFGPAMPDARSIVLGWSPEVGEWVVGSFKKKDDGEWVQVCDRVEVKALQGVAMASGQM